MKTQSSGLRLTTGLLLLFIALKLTNQIDWSWWWVMSPVWLPLILVLVAFKIWFLLHVLKKALR